MTSDEMKTIKKSIKQEKINVSDWLEYLEFLCSFNGSSQLGYITIIVSIIIAMFAAIAATRDFIISMSLAIVTVVYFFMFRKDMGNKHFFKGKVAGELAATIISKKYPKLKNVNDIEDCWLELDSRIDKLSWNERRKLLSNRNNEGFKNWFKETSEKYQNIEIPYEKKEP